jgi:hypothetical protein
LDVALLNAVKANIVVVQAAGNGGPYEQTITSFIPGTLLARKKNATLTYLLWKGSHLK